MAGHLDRFRQPWLVRDVNALLQQKEIRHLQATPYVGLHVRRGDKLVHEAQAVAIEVRTSASNIWRTRPLLSIMKKQATFERLTSDMRRPLALRHDSDLEAILPAL